MPKPSATAAATPAVTPVVDFEAAMTELETLVERLETGDLPLEESLQAFERGIALTRSCQSALKDAEQKVEVLLKKAGQPVIQEFEEPDGDGP